MKLPRPRLPKRCECGGKMLYSFAFGRVFSCCEKCSPVVKIDLKTLRPRK